MSLESPTPVTNQDNNTEDDVFFLGKAYEDLGVMSNQEIDSIACDTGFGKSFFTRSKIQSKTSGESQMLPKLPAVQVLFSFISNQVCINSLC